MRSSILKPLALLLLAGMGAKSAQAQALVWCLESDGGVELEMATGAQCADRIDTTRGEAPSAALDNCPEEAEHCGNCTDFGVPHASLKTGRVEAGDVDAPRLNSDFLFSTAPPSESHAINLTALAPLLLLPAPISTTASLRTTVLLI